MRPQAGPRILTGRPLLAEPRHGQDVHQGIQLRPQGLGIGHHPQAGHPCAVRLIDELHVREYRAPVALAVGLAGRLDGIQGDPDRPVPDRMDVRLEPGRIHLGHGLS